MTTALIIIAIILMGTTFALLFIQTIRENAIYPFIFSIFFIFLAGLSHDIISKRQAVDLPEEYKCLSKNNNKPDTVLAFYNNDTVFIQFKLKP